MSDKTSKKYPSVQKFQSPAEPQQVVTDGLNNEYFHKIANPSGRRFSAYPAVSISDSKIVQNYGTVAKDVTHEFYTGPDTVYNISTISTVKDKHNLNAKGGQRKTGKDKPMRERDGRKVGFTPPSLDGNIVSLENKRRGSNNNNNRKSAGERRLGLAPIRSLSSAGTSLSSDREFLEELKETLQRRESCLDTQAWHAECPLPGLPLREDSASTKHDSELPPAKEEICIYMTGSNTNRAISKGELKKKQIGKRMHRETASRKVKASHGRMPLAISGKAPEATPVKDAHSYQIRQKYTDDIERKWFLKMVEKTQNKKEGVDALKRRYDLRLDMFYSPEPNDEVRTDSDSTGSQASFGDSLVAGHDEDTKDEEEEEQVLEQSFNNETFSPLKKLNETSSVRSSDIPSFRPKPSRRQCNNQDKHKTLQHFDSTDVLVGNVGELEESSGSDIETVLQNGELQQRRCKHKMYRKRRRQRKRYKPFIQVTNASDGSEDGGDNTTEPRNTQAQLKLERFSIKQLREMRLKKAKRPIPCVKGLARFRQMANVVFVFVQFRKMLNSIRRIRRKAHKHSLRKSRKVKWNNELEIYTKYERQISPVKEPLHEKFMKEIGVKLLDDIAKLPILMQTESVTSGDSDTEAGEEGREKTTGRSFYREVQKADISDVANITVNQKSLYRKRRPSLCVPERPEYIAFTLRDKHVTKRSQRGAINHRSKSPSKSKRKPRQCTPLGTAGNRSPKQLPPLITPHPQGSKLVPEGHKHSHGKLSPSPRRKLSSTKRSKSQRKRPRSHSPSELRKVVPCFSKEVKIWPEVYRPRSYSASYVQFKQEVTLRELLKDADIPAKEVTIQIIERKRNRRRRKMADAAAREERLAFQRKVALELAEKKRQELAQIERQEEVRKRLEELNRPKYSSPFVSSGVAWNQRRSRPLPTWTNKELDFEITKLSGLFFEMRHCSYIRRSHKDQAILNRLSELEEVKI